MVRQATASKRQQKQAYRQYIFVSSIELSNQVPACHLVSRIGTVLESHKKPWTGSQAGDRSSMGASRSVGQLGPPGPPPHHDALEALDSRGTPCCTLCLVSASWESVGRRDPTARLGGRNPHGSRPPACLPDAPNVNGKCKCTTACDSARACPALPDFFVSAFSTRAPTDRVAVVFDSCIV
jgi:hypothetical protein